MAMARSPHASAPAPVDLLCRAHHLGIYIAFTNKALTGVGALHPKWVGFANFTHMFNDPLFINSLVLTLLFVLGSAVVGQNTLGFLIALLERGRIRSSLPPSIGSSSPPGSCPRSSPHFAGTHTCTRGGRWTASWATLGSARTGCTRPRCWPSSSPTYGGGPPFPCSCTRRAVRPAPELLEAAQVDGASQLALLRRVILPLSAAHSDQPDADHPADAVQLHPHIRYDRRRPGGGEPDHPASTSTSRPSSCTT